METSRACTVATSRNIGGGRGRARRAPPRRRAPAAAPVPGLRDGDIESVYRRYVEEHRRVKDPRPVLALETLRERLRVQVPKVLASSGGFKRVALDVAVEDGKVRLKALPVKD